MVCTSGWRHIAQVVVGLEMLAMAEAPEIAAGELLLGTPPWMACALAREIGVAARWEERVVIVEGCGIPVVGSPAWGGPASVGSLVVQDRRSGEVAQLSLRCHPHLPPSRWWDLTSALAYGLSEPIAVVVAGLRF